MTRDVKWADWKMTDSAENLKMFREADKEYLVLGIEEDVITKSFTEDNIPVHLILDEGERVKLIKSFENSSDLTYFKNDADTDTSAYYRVLNTLNQLDTFYRPTMQKMHITVTEGNYKVTGDTRIIPIVEQ